MAKKDYKPLLFTTTVRNPERFKQYLYVLNKFVGCILDDTLAPKICAEAMRFGIYRPNKKSTAIKTKWESSSQGGFSDVMLSDSEVKWLLQNNPQNHKEAGFSKGWPSRFATIFSSLKQYGFAFFKPGCKVEISEIGSLLLSNLVVEVNDDSVKVDNSHYYFGIITSLTNESGEYKSVDVLGIEFKLKKGSKAIISAEGKYNSDDEIEFAIINKKPILPREDELSMNRRSHSAKLRIIEKN